MLYVCLDTNAVDLERPFEANSHSLLLEAADADRIGLCVPALVLDETVNLWREKVEQVVDQRSAAEDELLRKGVISEAECAPLLNVAEAAQQLRDRLESKLSEVGALVAPLPGVDHASVVQRALDRRQPFDRAGKDGYRDVLVWESVLLVDQGHDVILVSGDVRAFCASKADRGLSPTLRDEVRLRGGRDDAVRVVPSARDAVDDLLGNSPEAEADFDALLEDQDVIDQLVEKMDAALEGVALSRDIAGAVLPTARKVLSAGVSFPVEFEDLRVRFARRSADGALRVDLEADYTAWLTFTIPIEDFATVVATSDIGSWSVGDDEIAGGELLAPLTVLLEVVVTEPASNPTVRVRLAEVLEISPE